MPYEFLDEIAIADVEFRAWGKGLAEVFMAAAEATMNVMVRDLDTIEPRQQQDIVLENEALDMLLFDFLQELIYFKDAENLLLRIKHIDIQESPGAYRLRGFAAGEAVNPQRHDRGADVKAVTLHRFSLERQADNWQAYVILDI